MKKLSFTIAVVLFIATIFTMPAMSEKIDNSEATIVRNLDIFNSLYKELNTFYVDSIDAQKSIETAINAMLDDIDPYTEYIPAKSRDDFQVISTGEYGGIGSYIQERRGDKKGVYISGPYEGSPAARAGVRTGDRIVMIDGDSVADWSSDKVSARLKGLANTKLSLTVVRPYCDDSIKTFDITRETIKLSPVPYYGVVQGDMGYINLTTFNEHSFTQVRDALIDLKKNPNVKSIVLDLRGNGGGLMESAVQIVGLFVPKGTTVLTTRGRDKQSEKTYKTTADPIDAKIPLAVLVDGGSASAAEITAGAMQDLDRAVVIGSRSFGKGLVQSVRPLPFDGALKVTIAKYYIPSGRLIQEIDYSQRDANGSYRHLPDSLARVFHTAHNREVREGGGITPDIKVDYPDLTRLVYNIVRDNWAFDYATKFAAEHPTIAPPAEFVITDDIFNDFKGYIDPKKFQYDKVCETGIENLRKVAKAEGYINDETGEAFDRLESLLKHDLSKDLDTHRSEIEKILAREIITRYYYQAGEVELDTRYDETLDRAHEMFTKSGEYRRILNL